MLIEWKKDFTDKNWAGLWEKIQHSPIWALLILWVALGYMPEWYTRFTATPFHLEHFTDILFMWYQRLMHIPLFICAYMIFAKRWTWFSLGMISLLVGIVTENALFDFRIHNILMEYDIYPNRWKMSNGDVNSNYMKMSLFFIVFPLFLLRFIQKSYRTFDRTFALVMTMGVMTTSLIFHHLWIDREYKQVRDREMAHISAAIDLSESAFKELCKNSDWGCWLGYPTAGTYPDGTQKNPLISDFLRKDIDKMLENPMCKQKCVIISGKIIQNKFAPIPLGLAYKEGVWRFIIDAKYTEKQFLEIRSNLACLGIIAANVWIYGIMMLWGFHQKRFKARASKMRELLNVKS